MMTPDDKVSGWVKKGQNHDEVILECPPVHITGPHICICFFYLNFNTYVHSSTTVFFFTYSSCPIIQSYQIIFVAIFHARKGEGKSFLPISSLFDSAGPVEGLKVLEGNQ